MYFSEERFVERQEIKQKLNHAVNVGVGKQTYADMCDTLYEVPIRRITDQLRLTCMRLHHVGMNDNQCKAFACAIWVSFLFE